MRRDFMAVLLYFLKTQKKLSRVIMQKLMLKVYSTVISVILLWSLMGMNKKTMQPNGR